MNIIENFFKIKQNNTSIKTEAIAGFTTFLTMSYIIFVNPSILSNAGIPFDSTVTATCLVSAIITILMGVATNYPFAVAPGMGLNAFLAYTVCITMGKSWQTAMAIIFIEGLIITILVLTKFRQTIMNAIPISLKRAIGVGIGIFIAFIGLRESGFIQSNPVTFLTLGDFSKKSTIISLVGLIIIIILLTRKIKGALLLGIILTTFICLPFKLVSLPQKIIDTPSFETFGKFVFGIKDAINITMWGTILAFLLSDFFDTMGTVIAIGEEGRFLKNGNLPKLSKVLLIDSLGAVFGGVFSASSATTYIESAAGVAEGGRTGFSSVIVGILFLISIFFAPVVGIVPQYAVAPVLIVVGFLMITVVRDIDWEKIENALPAFFTIIFMPLTHSISNGIGFGIISYVGINIIKGKVKEIHPLLWIITLFFILHFIS